MADYYYGSNTTTATSKGRFGAKFQSWDTVQGGMKGSADGWSNSIFPDKGDGCGDHVRKPVILSPSARAEPGDVYPFQHHNDDSIHKHEPCATQPAGTHGYEFPKRDSSGSKVGNNRWIPNGGTYEEAREFIQSVQNAVSGERRMGFPGGMFQSHVANRNGYGTYQNSNDTSANGWKKHANGYATDAVASEEYLMIPCGGAHASRTGGVAPNNHGNPLSRATNDIGTAVSYTKESPWPPSHGMLTKSSPSGDITIDSTEAAKKYNGYFI